MAAIVASVSSCKDEVEDPPNPNEEELITTVELKFTDTASMQSQSFRFADPDGEGGNAPTTFDTIVLDANSFYTVEVSFLNESESPVEDITEEVLEEANEHLVCYEVSAGNTVTITDQDGNALPLGLQAELSTGAAGMGNFKVSLKHQPDVKNGQCDVGETDVEVDFSLRLE